MVRSGVELERTALADMPRMAWLWEETEKHEKQTNKPERQDWKRNGSAHLKLPENISQSKQTTNKCCPWWCHWAPPNGEKVLK